MHIEMLGPERMRLTRLTQAEMSINENTEAPYGPVPMLATSWAWCTFHVLVGYGARIGVVGSGMVIEASWQLAERPHRVTHMALDIAWPGLPESRLDATMRAAGVCTLHQTLKEAVELEVFIHP